MAASRPVCAERALRLGSRKLVADEINYRATRPRALDGRADYTVPSLVTLSHSTVNQNYARESHTHRQTHTHTLIPPARAQNKSSYPVPLAAQAKMAVVGPPEGGLTCTSSTGFAFWPSCRTSWTSPTSRSTSLSTCRSSGRARAPPRWCRAGPPWSPPARS